MSRSTTPQTVVAPSHRGSVEKGLKIPLWAMPVKVGEGLRRLTGFLLFWWARECLRDWCHTPLCETTTFAGLISSGWTDNMRRFCKVSQRLKYFRL